MEMWIKSYEQVIQKIFLNKLNDVTNQKQFRYLLTFRKRIYVLLQSVTSWLMDANSGYKCSLVHTTL